MTFRVKKRRISISDYLNYVIFLSFSLLYRAYLNYWLADVKRRLLADFQLNESTSSSDNFSDSLAVAYSHRIKPDIRDANLLDELKRSIEVMPLEKEERQRLASTISAIRKLGEQKRFQMDSKLQKINNNVIDLLKT